MLWTEEDVASHTKHTLSLKSNTSTVAPKKEDGAKEAKQEPQSSNDDPAAANEDVSVKAEEQKEVILEMFCVCKLKNVWSSMMDLRWHFESRRGVLRFL